MARIRDGLLYVVLLTSAAVLALRVLLGPFEWGVPVNSPLNAESGFGLALLGLILSASPATRHVESPPLRPEGSAGTWIVGLIVLTLLAFWRSLSVGFLSDDFVLITQANAFSFSHVPALFTTPGGDGFFRPLGYVALGLNAFVAGWDPLLWHASGLLVHVVNVLLVYRLGNEIFRSRLPAGVTALLFSLHGTRPEAVTWVAGRFDLLMTLFVLVSWLLFARYRETRSGPLLVVSVAAFAVAALIKETGFCLPLLLGLTLLSGRDRQGSAPRWLLPYLGTGLVLFVCRWKLLGGIGGYENPKTGLPEILDLSVLSSLNALLVRVWTVLFFPLNWSVEPGGVVALLLLLSLPAWMWLASRNSPDRSHLFHALGFTLLSALPAFPQLLIGADLQKSRLLYLPSIGLALLLGSLVASAGSSGIRLKLAGGLLILFAGAALQHNLRIWQEVAERYREACRQASAAVEPGVTRVVGWNLPDSLRGVYFLQSGWPECVQLHSAGSIPSVELGRGNTTPASGPDTLVFAWDERTETLSVPER